MPTHMLELLPLLSHHTLLTSQINPEDKYTFNSSFSDVRSCIFNQSQTLVKKKKSQMCILNKNVHLINGKTTLLQFEKRKKTFSKQNQIRMISTILLLYAVVLCVIVKIIDVIVGDVIRPIREKRHICVFFLSLCFLIMR